MAVLPIVQLGHPILRSKARPVPLEKLKEKSFQQLIKAMVETLEKAEGLGLAAPQVNQSWRLFLAYPPSSPAVASSQPQVFINPEIEAQSEELVEDWEGCLSFNFLRGLVPRPRWVRMRAWNEKGEEFIVEAYDLWARVLQHEYDHLEGILYLDRMADLRSLMSLSEFEARMKKEKS